MNPPESDPDQRRDRGSGPLDQPPRLLDGPRAALALLTRLPVGGRAIGERGRRRAPSYFPLVGLLLGGLMATALHLTAPFLGQSLAALLAILVGLLATGALHEDGLADTADAWGGARGDRQRLFTILKDSRHGSYGVLALVMVVALRWGCLTRLGAAAPAALLLAAPLSRTAAVWLMARLPYVTPAASAVSGSSAEASGRQALVATLLSLAIAAALVRAGGLDPRKVALGTLAALLATWWLARRFRALAGGITGDFLGTAQQVTELCVLLALILRPGA